MFASTSVSEHLLRGIIGICVLVLGFLLPTKYPILLVLGLIIAYISFRGCPICWTFGLVNTCRIAKQRTTEESEGSEQVAPMKKLS